MGVYPSWVPKLLVNYTHNEYTHPWRLSARVGCTRVACNLQQFGHPAWVYTHLCLALYFCTGGPVPGVGVEIEVPRFRAFVLVEVAEAGAEMVGPFVESSLAANWEFGIALNSI